MQTGLRYHIANGFAELNENSLLGLIDNERGIERENQSYKYRRCWGR
jgi:hypothetical protein